MPVAAAVAPLAGSVIGAIAGGSNPRPPSLSQQQQAALNTSLQTAQQSANEPAKIDPVQQSALFQQNAQQLTGANAQVDHALAARGISRSGIAASALQNNAAQSSANQNNIDLNLQQAAVQNKQFNQSLVNNLLNVKDTPGQTTTGAISAGIAAPLTYASQQYANNNPSPIWQNIPFQNNSSPSAYDSSGRAAADLGNYS